MSDLHTITVMTDIKAYDSLTMYMCTMEGVIAMSEEFYKTDKGQEVVDVTIQIDGNVLAIRARTSIKAYIQNKKKLEECYAKV